VSGQKPEGRRAGVLKEFREFIERGNVVDLAVAVILGIAFNEVVQSFTKSVLMPLIAVITGGSGPNFDYTLDLRGKTIAWGVFLAAVVNFLIIAFATFLIVKAINKARSLGHHKEAEDKEIALTEVELLEEIRDLLAEDRKGRSILGK
jgi:large conductance mechanosensitive channel